MTIDRLIEEVKAAIGIVSDDTDIDNQIRIRIYAVIQYINRGGANLNIETLTEYEIFCIARGVDDMLNQNGNYSEGFVAMASQIQLGGQADEQEQK